ncbi:uncharacterized protein [Ptychodera flava]|uniref:uncharacterized protein n=1 Tax=Ptychodera flava TaxID=63121 RepID=UPI00396A4C4D
MARQVLGDISMSLSRPALSQSVMTIPDSFLTPSPVHLPSVHTSTVLQNSLLDYENLKRRLNLTEAQYQLHKNNILQEDSDEDEDDDVLGSFETPPKTPKPQQRKSRAASTVTTDDASGSQQTETPKVKRQRVQRKQKEVALSTQLGGLTRQQLVDMMVSLKDSHPELEQEIRELMPAPDLTSMEQRLDSLQHNIYKAFPYTRWGSSRDAFCYRRVKVHLTAFKKECVDQGKTLMKSEFWETVIDYALMAWKFVEKLPDWDNPAHNGLKDQCFKSLATQCKQALKKSRFEKEKYHQIKSRLETAVMVNYVMESCVEEVDKILSKLP